MGQPGLVNLDIIDLCDFLLMEIITVIILPNELMQNYSPYNFGASYSASSHSNLQGLNRLNSEPQGSSQRHKSYLIQKMQALLPYLSAVLKQNDDKTNGVVNKLTGLKDNMDGIFEDLEKELMLSSSENQDLKQRLRTTESQSRVVEVKR
jgi:hypothetical protein